MCCHSHAQLTQMATSSSTRPASMLHTSGHSQPVQIHPLHPQAAPHVPALKTGSPHTGQVTAVQTSDTARLLPLTLLAGPGCSSTAGRLLPKPGGLVCTECAGCGAGHLRLPLVSLHQQGDQAVRLQQQRAPGQRVLRGLEPAGHLPLCGHQQWGDPAVGCGQDQAHQNHAGQLKRERVACCCVCIQQRC